MRILQNILFYLFLSLLVGCQGNEEKKKMEKPTEVEFKFAESFESFKNRYPNIKIDQQPIGANFYSFRWPEESPATIIFDMKEYSASFPYTISLLMMEAGYKSFEGVTQFSFKSGISYEKTISHDDARLKFHEFLQELIGNGWKRRLSYTHPRLLGSQAMHYMRKRKSTYPLDPNYLPTLEEWKTIDKLGTYWQLHADNKAFMTIDLKLKQSKTDPNIGVYLLSITIKNDQEIGRGLFDNDEQHNWNEQEKWGVAKKKFLSIREKTEKDLISKGYEIDENYEDYEIEPKVSQ